MKIAVMYDSSPNITSGRSVSSASTVTLMNYIDNNDILNVLYNICISLQDNIFKKLRILIGVLSSRMNIMK